MLELARPFIVLDDVEPNGPATRLINTTRVPTVFSLATRPRPWGDFLVGVDVEVAGIGFVLRRLRVRNGIELLDSPIAVLTNADATVRQYRITALRVERPHVGHGEIVEAEAELAPGTQAILHAVTQPPVC